MSDGVVFPSFDEACWLHALLIDRFGGTHGLREPGLLESALARPRSGYHDSLSARAAVMLQSLALNHCFLDGNKRMAVALVAVFLRLNGRHLLVEPAEGERFVVDDVIVGRADVTAITAWLERHGAG